jgi:hypothetical protein
MTDTEKIAMTRVYCESDPGATDEVIRVYLQMAQNKMLERLYPFDADKDVSDIPSRYDSIQCELAGRYFLRQGGQAETSHEENGINRTYGSVDDEDILSRLTPFAKVGG